MIKDEKFLDEIRKRPCIICGKRPPSHASHIKSLGSGGDDSRFNVFPMCFRCHRKWHDLGARVFLGKYPNFFALLRHYGWFFDGSRLINFFIRESSNSSCSKRCHKAE